ncbi:hypothetical protein [Listeria fleischmannii]|uniref:Uncharacterized protein n=1 Tax=Listeria fleischmannii FSL S10-1203 TaxID=1265822 RepID=W7DNL6_9LIST|nr:hypothetical protein [Listeria fleischmannii]EUJ59496.1 hypothetical protein MCOL2_05840 [Listeria fleischmannii FSL S10-1203]
MKKVERLVVVGAREYRVFMDKIRDLGVNQTFKGVQVTMLNKNGDFFAKKRFPSTVSPVEIESWMREMHYSDDSTETLINAFQKWDGVLDDY